MPPAEELILAIDLGTSGAKAAVVATDGRIAGTGEVHVDTSLLPDNGAEQDPEAVWQAVLRASSEALAAAGNRRDVVAVTCCSQYSSIVPVDGAGRPLMNMVLWLDQRGAPARLRQLPGGERLRDHLLRQLRWMRVHGIPPLDSGVDSLSHMRFIRFAHPEIYERTAAFLEPMDYVTARLCGRATTNVCSGFLMLLMDNRDLEHARYDPTLVKWSLIDQEKLPELVRVDEPVGTLLPEVAAALDLDPGVTVWPGINDTQAGGMGSASFAGTHAGLSVGTTSVMITHVPFKRTDIRNSLVSMPSPLTSTYFVMAENGVGGRALEHFLDRFVFASDHFGDHIIEGKFAALQRAVAEVEPGSDGVLFLPWLRGSLSPAEDGRVRGGFLNVSLDTTREHLGRAVLEGVMLNFRWLSGAVEHFTGRRFDRLSFYGGGAQSDPWAQILADVMQLPVHQLADSRFVNCRGLALLVALRRGRIGTEEIEKLVPVRAVREPRPELAARYDHLFGQFVRAFRANRSIFRALNP